MLTTAFAGAFTLVTALGQEAPKPVAVNAAPAGAAAVAPGGGEAAANARNIRFQFDGIAYTDVLERFAQMANKPLVTATNIVGTLSYNDPNPYTFQEALDTLNVILAMKGTTLIEAGNYLRLVPFKELPSMPLRILRGTGPVGDVRPGEIVTTVLEVKNVDSKEIADAVTSMLSNAGSVATLSRGRGLIITDRMSNIQRIKTLLATIDTEAAVDRQMKTYSLTHSSGAIISDLLNRTFGVSTAPKRTQYNATTKALETLPADPNDYITSVYDDASRTLVLFGPNERIALAEELINKFEQREGAAGDVRIYFPQSIKAEELANIIRQAIPGVAVPNEPLSTSATKARVISDGQQNRLIVSSPVAGQLEQIENLINRVDKPVHGNNIGGLTNVPMRSQTIQMTKVFRPRATGAKDFSQILTQALTRKEPNGRVITTSSVTHDAASQSVVVSGPPGDLQTASEILTQLETGSSQPTQLETKFIDVGSQAEAKRLQPLVEQLYRNQVSGSGAVGAVAHAKILADSDSGRLIVTASADHLERIESLVKQIQGDRSKSQTRRLQIIPLKNVRVETAQTGIQSLINERLTDRRFTDVPKPSVIPDAGNNRLLVTATEDQLAEIQEIVNVVDLAPAVSKRELRVFPLRARTAGELIPVVNQMLDQTAEQPVNAALAPKLMADPSGKQILVLAASTDFDRVEALIRQFDASPATVAPRQFRGIELVNRTATEFTPIVQQLYTEQLRGQNEPVGGPATLIAEARGNRIMVSGPESEITRVETIIRQLDPAGKALAKEETRVIRLKAASANELVGIVEKSLNARQQQVRVLVDTRSNSLVVTGDTSNVEAASQIVQQLDTRSESGPKELRIIELKSTDAASLAPMVNNLFSELMKDQRGADYTTQTRIVPDTAANRIIVTGVKGEIEEVSGLVQKLDNAPEQAPGARVFKLNQSDAVMMAPIVSNAMVRFDQRGQAVRRVTVSVDDKSNSIIVSGTRTDLQDAESVIEKLDGQGPGNSKERVLRIFDVKSDPDTLATLAMKVFSAQNPGRNTTSVLSITPEAASRRLIVLAPPLIMAQVETLITSLDSKPEQGNRELHVVEVKNGSAADLLPKVTAIYSEQAQGKTLKPATIYADASGTKFSVYGTQDQADTVKQIADTLAGAPQAARETKAFDVGKLSEAQRLLPLVQQLYREQVSNSPQLGAADAKMMSDGRSGLILVTARPDQIKLIEDLIQRLQATSTASPARETRTIEVGTASDVQRLLPMVQKLYADQWKDKPETDPADAQIVGDPQTGRLILTGKPEHLKQIEAILQQLGTGKARTQVRDTRMFDLTTAVASELVGTVRSLYLELAKSRFGAQAPDTLITPDSGGNRIIAVGDTTELDAVEDVIKKLDKVSAQSSSARVFKIKSADPTTIARILEASLVRIDAFGRSQKRATVSVDTKTRTLIVTGDPKELQGVSVIIEQLDRSLGEQPERKMQVVTLKQGRPTEVIAKVRQLYTDQVQSQPELAMSEVLLMEDGTNNQIILAGSEEQLKLLNRILSDLQASQVSKGERETKMFDLGHPDEVTRLLPLVQQLYQDRVKGRDMSDPADAKLMADPKNARLIVTARTNHMAEIESVLTQLRGTGQTAARETRLFDLTNTSAPDLVPTVKTLYQEQAKSRPAQASVDTLILADTSANRIIVTATTNELASVEEIILKLDKAGVQNSTTRVFKLKFAEPNKILEILTTALVRYDPYGRVQKRVNIVADAKTRSLIAMGEAKELQAASIIIEQLDQSLGEQPDRKMEVISLKGRRAFEIATKLRTVYQDRARTQPDLSTSEALILEDTPSNQIMVVGTDKQLALIQEIAQTLEKAGSGSGREARVLTLEHNSARAIAEMLTRLYPRQTGSSDPTDRLVVSAGGDDNTLVVDGLTRVLEQVEQLVRTMDKADPALQTTFQAVHLEKGRADDLATAVTQSLSSRPNRGKLSKVSMTPVIGANTLLINGPTAEVDEVVKIIKTLDTESHGDEIEVRIYKLENGTAREVSAVIQQLLQNVTRRSARNRPANVSVDARSNALIISGSVAHFKVVEKILPTLDKAPERSDRDVQFVWLKKAKAYDVVSKLESVFEGRPSGERPIIEADPMNNSLTIIAKRGDIAQLQDLVARLDDQSKDSSVQVRLRPLDNVVAEQMAKMLQNVYPQMSRGVLRVVEKVEPPARRDVSTNAPGSTTTTNATSVTVDTAVATNATASATNTVTTVSQTVLTSTTTTNLAVAEVVVAVDKTANALILSGPAQELDNVDRIISELSSNFFGNEAEFRLFPLKDADPLVVAKALAELLRQQPVQAGQPQPQQQGFRGGGNANQSRITVVAEPRTRSIIVRARPTDFALMESLIKQLDSAGISSQVEFRVVPLTNAPPMKVLPLVQQMVTQMSASRPGDPVTVAAEPRSRGILVIAREPMIEQVEKMIHSLDTPAPNVEAEVMIFALKKANASQLATVLQGMLRPGIQGEATSEARELQEQIRRLRVIGDNGAAVTLDLTKPIKISADGNGGGNRLILTSTPENLKGLAAVIELMDTPQITEGVNVRIVKLQHADAGVVSQTLQSVFTQGRQLATGPGGPGAQPEGLTGKALVHPLGVGVDARSNTLILSGTAETIELASKIIEDVDKQLDRFVTEVRLFRLKHASAIRMLPLLQSVFAEGPPVAGTEGLNTQVTRLRTIKEGGQEQITQAAKQRVALTIQADDIANILIVAARSEMLPLIADVIEQMDIPAASGLETVRIYPLTYADPITVQRVFTDLYAGQRPGSIRNEDRPVISIDDRTGSLIVAGSSKSFAILETLIKQLDQKLPFDLREIRMIPLQNTDAVAVAGTLQKLMDARLTQKAALNKGQVDTLKVIILADARSNALLVGGSKESFELVEVLSKQLDQSGPALSGSIRLIALEVADSRVIASTLTALFEQRYAAARTSDVQRNKPIILPDPRSNSLLVTANQEDNRTIDDLLKKLDRRMENPSLTLTVISLFHNDASRVATMVETIFTARRAAQSLPGQQPLPSTQIKIEPDPLNNSLVISASKENLEVIQGLVAKLDAEPTIAGGVLETFTLQFADAQRVSSMLTSLVQQGLYRPGQLPNAPKVSARDNLAMSVDTRSNTLFVSASPETLAVVREVIKRVDSEDLGLNGDVRLYQLTHSRASSLAATLEQFFRAKLAADSVAINANTKRVPAAVIPDDRINTIVVLGGKEAFDFVERMLPQLDGESTFTRLNFQVFPLKKATAVRLRTTLQPIFANRPPRVKGEPVDPITIVADAWVNALLVGATVEDMSSVSSLIERLDNEATPLGLAVHVFPLAKADARKVALTIQALFRESTPNQVLPIQVSADERINAIVVSCGDDDAKRIGELVTKLDTEQVARVSEIRVFPLKNARAESLSTILNTALNTRPPSLSDQQNPNAQSVLQFITRSEEGRELVTAALKESVLITPDGRMNSLIVSGPVDYMGLLEQIITRLDAGSPQEAKIKVFTLKNAHARQMAELLTQLFRMTQSATTGTQRSIQYTLMRPGTDDAGASATLGSAEQTALTVTVDPRTNSLLVGGTDHYVSMVEQIIETLDEGSDNERTTEVVRLKNSQASDVAVAVRGFLDQERQRVTQVLGADAVGTAQQMLEREVAIVAEQLSNTLLLSASPRYFGQVKALIQELDKSQPQVLIQVLLAEVSLNSTSDLGVDWTQTGRLGGNPYALGGDTGTAAALQSFGGYSALMTGGDFSFLLRALKDDSRLEVLSRPQIVTADNKPASINIGQRVPLISDSRVTERGDTINSFRYEDVGVNLTVTPKISPDGFVKLEIGTTNSAISSSNVEINKSATVPIINQRKANTTVSVQSGQTIIIGGLIGTMEDRRVKKLPWLGDIPYLGNVFRSTRVTREKKELLIFLTPQVLANNQSAVPLNEFDDVVKEQVEKSRLKDEIRRNDFNKPMMDPIFPAPATPPVAPKRSKAAGS